MYITVLLYHFYIYDIYLSRNLYSYFYLNIIRINLVFIRNIYFCYFSLERYSRKNSNSPSDNHLYLRLHRGMHLVAASRSATRSAAKVHLLEIDCEQANRFFISSPSRGTFVRCDCENESFFFSSRYNARIDGFE